MWKVQMTELKSRVIKCTCHYDQSTIKCNEGLADTMMFFRTQDQAVYENIWSPFFESVVKLLCNVFPYILKKFNIEVFSFSGSNNPFSNSNKVWVP